MSPSSKCLCDMAGGDTDDCSYWDESLRRCNWRQQQIQQAAAADLEPEAYAAFQATRERMVKAAVSAAPEYMRMLQRLGVSADSRAIYAAREDAQIEFSDDYLEFSFCTNSNWGDWEYFSMPLAYLRDPAAYERQQAEEREQRALAAEAEFERAYARQQAEKEAAEREQLARLTAKYQTPTGETA